MAGTPSPTTVSTSLQRIATLAREAPQLAFTTLAHHIDIGFLREAYRRTRKDGAVGVDGQTAQAYAEDLERNLESLLHRFKSGAYQAPPVRRVYIPKDDGRSTRPLGIPMAYAYCISLPRRLGIAVAASTSMNSILPAHAV